jgi:hypothetical protein
VRRLFKFYGFKETELSFVDVARPGSASRSERDRPDE